MTLRFLLFVVLAAASAGAGVRADEPVRAIFDEAVYWANADQAKLEALLTRVRRAGFNTYIPCVWHGQGATWPTGVVDTWYANPELADRDPLARFVALAKRYEIRVMPCITLMLRQHSFYPELVSKSGHGRTFNVHDPRFRRFARDLVLDVALRYPIDGINLDYVRAGEVCFDTDCRADYAARTGRDLMADLAAHKVSAEALGSIVNWQRAAVRELLASIAQPLREQRPGLLVTVSAAPWAESVVIEGQDSIEWAEAGLVDLILSMNYQDAIPWSTLQRLRDGMKTPERLAVMVSDYREPPAQAGARPPLVSRSGPELTGLVRAAREFNPAGHFAVYLYSMLTDEQVRALGEEQRLVAE